MGHGGWLLNLEGEEAGPFDSAEVRFAQDDRFVLGVSESKNKTSFFDMNSRDETLAWPVPSRGGRATGLAA
jgi:hypothetical protein